MAALGDIRYVVDENLLRLGAGLAAIRRDTARFAAEPLDELLPQGIADVDWIPVVGDNGWVVITNDRRIRTRPVEAELAVRHRLKVIHLHGAIGSGLPWDQLTRMTTRWPAIQKQVDADGAGPWWLSVQRAGTRLLRFEPGVVER